MHADFHMQIQEFAKTPLKDEEWEREIVEYIGRNVKLLKAEDVEEIKKVATFFRNPINRQALDDRIASQLREHLPTTPNAERKILTDSTDESEEEEIPYPEVPGVPPITLRSSFSFLAIPDIVDPSIYMTIADFGRKHYGDYKKDRVNELYQEAAMECRWLQDCFPELVNHEKFERISESLQKAGVPLLANTKKVGDVKFEVEEPVNPKHKTLCVGVGRLGENTRKHDPATSYTINLNSYGDPHVSDDIRMLPTRNYLGEQKFDTIYIEVSCSPHFYINPELMTFLNQHLEIGGKVYLEMPGRLLNESLGVTEEFKHGQNPCYDIRNKDEWPGKRDVNITGDAYDVTYSYKEDEHGEDRRVVIYQKFKGDWKEFFERYGFGEASLSKIRRVQIGTLPVEITKTREL